MKNLGIKNKHVVVGLITSVAFISMQSSIISAWGETTLVPPESSYDQIREVAVGNMKLAPEDSDRLVINSMDLIKGVQNKDNDFAARSVILRDAVLLLSHNSRVSNYNQIISQLNAEIEAELENIKSNSPTKTISGSFGQMHEIDDLAANAGIIEIFLDCCRKSKILSIVPKLENLLKLVHLKTTKDLNIRIFKTILNKAEQLAKDLNSEQYQTFDRMYKQLSQKCKNDFVKTWISFQNFEIALTLAIRSDHEQAYKIFWEKLNGVCNDRPDIPHNDAVKFAMDSSKQAKKIVSPQTPCPHTSSGASSSSRYTRSPKDEA